MTKQGTLNPKVTGSTPVRPTNLTPQNPNKIRGLARVLCNAMQSGKLPTVCTTAPQTAPRNMATRLTDRTIKSAKVPTSGRIELRDAAVPGLHLRISASGSKVWGLYYYVEGHKRRHTIGDLDTYTLAQAREDAIIKRRMVAEGIDINEVKRAKKRAESTAYADTFEGLVASYIRLHQRGAGHAIGKKDAAPNNRTWEDTEYLLNRYCAPTFAGRSIHSIGMPA